MSHVTDRYDQMPPPAPAVRSPWFWLAALLAPCVLFFAVLGVWSAFEKWHIVWSPNENAAIERTGAAPWLPQERRADMKRRIAQIDKQIPALLDQENFLEAALKRERARAAASAEAKEYEAFIRRERELLEERLENLRSDRAYYVHELGEK